MTVQIVECTLYKLDTTVGDMMMTLNTYKIVCISLIRNCSEEWQLVIHQLLAPSKVNEVDTLAVDG